MPPPRKVDLLPPELRGWLNDELKARGFGDYEAIAAALNERLAAEGAELRIGKSSVHAYGAEYREFVKLQEEASAWAAGWMAENGLEEEAQRHNVLFQMVTTLAFKQMQAQMEKSGEEISPQELHFIGRMLKDIMSSSGMREKLVADERKVQAARLEKAVETGDLDATAARKAREIMGFG